MNKWFKVMIVTLLVFAHGQAFGWSSGETHFYVRRGLTGGGMALDALSGASMCSQDTAIVFDLSGNTIYFHQVSATGNASGTTVETLPYWVSPNTSDSGQTLSGVSMWSYMGISGATGQFTSLVVNGQTIDFSSYLTAETDTTAMAALTAHTEPGAFTGVTDFAVDSQVSAYVVSAITAATSDSAFTGTSDFATNAELTAHTDPGSFAGVTDFALDSQVSDYVVSAINTATDVTAFTGVTDFALDSQVSAYVVLAITTATNDAAFTGTSNFATNAELTAHTDAGAVSGVSLAEKYALDTYLGAGGISGVSLPASGVSPFTGAYLSENQVAATVVFAWSGAGADDYAVACIPYSMALSGASLYVNSDSASGVSVSSGLSVGEIPPGGTTDYLLFNLSTATRSDNKSGATIIPAGTYVRVDLETVPSGASVWGVQIFGRKE